MAKQTAVDLFMAYVSKHKEFLGYDLDEVYKQAKEMEKEQIQKAYIEGAEIAKEVLKEELKEVFVLPKSLFNENNK